MEVRERIRINGMPLEKEEFTDYFFDVYDKLEATKPDYDNAMPAYFRFLTIMALHVFLQEKVKTLTFFGLNFCKNLEGLWRNLKLLSIWQGP